MATDVKCEHPDLVAADAQEEVLAVIMEAHGILHCNGDRVFMARVILAAGFVRLRSMAEAEQPPEVETRIVMQEVYEGYLSYVVECLKDIAAFTPYPHTLLHFDEWKARTANIGEGVDGKSDGS